MRRAGRPAGSWPGRDQALAAGDAPRQDRGHVAGEVAPEPRPAIERRFRLEAGEAREALAVIGDAAGEPGLLRRGEIPGVGEQAAVAGAGMGDEGGEQPPGGLDTELALDIGAGGGA